MKKRVLSLLLCLVMALSLLPTAAFAADGDTIIDRLEINYTTEHNYPGCLAYELLNELRDCLDYKYVGDGTHTNVAKCINVYLFSYTAPNRSGDRVQIDSSTPNLIDTNLHYYALFQLAAQAGYDFQHTGAAFDTSSLTCVINGGTSVAELSSGYNEYNKVIDVYVPIQIRPSINNVEITGLKQPVVGETAGENLQNVAIPAASHYTASSIKWWVSNDNSIWNEMPDGSKFETGKYYYYRVILAPEDGYCFPMGTVKPNYFAPYTGTVTTAELATRLVSVCARAGSPEYGTLDITGKTFQMNTVTFDMNGHGTAPAVQTVVKGNQATEPAAPTAIGYIFDGWYTNAACTTAFDFSTPITANTTVYAKWTDNRTTINSIDITVDTPIVGKTPAESMFVPTVTTDPANAVDVNMAWADWYNHGGNGKFTGIFQANTEYDYEICLMANEGYRFPSVNCDDMALANGAAVKYVDVSSNGEYAYIGIVMTPTCTHTGTVVTDKAVAATYAKTGKTAGTHCSACGEVLTAQKTVAMKIPAQAKITSITNTSTGITVKWGKVTGATAYQVYRKVGTGSWKLWKTTTSTSASNSGLTNGTKYQYKVRAVVKNSAGKIVNTGAYSTIKTMYRLTRPTLASDTKNIATRKIMVKWNKNSSASGYQVKYIKGTTTKTVKITSASTLSKTLSSLTKGSTYKVYVRSYKTVGSSTYYSAYSAYKSVKVNK